MRSIRPGGVYLLMPHGECYVTKTQGPPCLAANPKDGAQDLGPSLLGALRLAVTMRPGFAQA